MKSTHALVASAAILVSAARAATVISGYENPGPDGTPFLYLDKVIMTSTDSWSATANVGGWSYKNLNVSADPNRGWGHTSDWFLLELTQIASVTVSMDGSDPLAWAGFVIYAGESIHDDAIEAHTFSNNGQNIAALNGGWDNNGPGGTPGLTYVGHGHSATQSPDVSGTWTLGPGLYTIAFGNAADSATAPTAKEFGISITTVPEPSAALLSILAAGLFAGRRRRA